MKICITDCDHARYDQEEAVARGYGAEIVFANATTADELVAGAQGAQGLVVQYATIDAALLDRLPEVRVVSRLGVGYDSVDVAAATERGVAVFNVPDYGTESVSDHAIALALALLRQIPLLDRRARDGGANFEMARPLRLLAGQRFGVLGCGLIGTVTARKARSLGFEVVVQDLLATPGEDFHGFAAVSRDELLATSDVLSVHTPLDSSTRHIIDAAALESMKPQAVLVNTSRGPTLDCEALTRALQEGTIRAAALDVTEPEPLPLDHPLRSLDNTILTPHIAWYSEESYGELKHRTLLNAVGYLSGEVHSNLVNPEVLVSAARRRPGPTTRRRTVESRYACAPEHVATMKSDELRERFLVEDLFNPGEVKLLYSHIDRVILGGIMPTDEALTMPNPEQMRADFFFSKREAGVVNVGDDAVLVVDGQRHELPHKGCLYIGRGSKEVSFEAPGRYYLFSAPAHTEYPTAVGRPGEGTIRELGEQKTSNRRTLNQYIHENGIQSCQVVMGVTELHEGSMWNTMPAHTHERRMEAYLYFNLPDEHRVLHVMGQPQESRHMVVGNEQAILSPPWSLHCGVGTSAYSFVWAMAGENQSFDDMDGVPIAHIH